MKILMVVVLVVVVVRVVVVVVMVESAALLIPRAFHFHPSFHPFARHTSPLQGSSKMRVDSPAKKTTTTPEHTDRNTGPWKWLDHFCETRMKCSHSVTLRQNKVNRQTRESRAQTNIHQHRVAPRRQHVESDYSRRTFHKQQR